MDEFAFWGQIAGLYYKIGSATTPVNHSSPKDKKKKRILRGKIKFLVYTSKVIILHYKEVHGWSTLVIKTLDRCLKFVQSQRSFNILLGKVLFFFLSQSYRYLKSSLKLHYQTISREI